jgi:hypothetical protein
MWQISMQHTYQLGSPTQICFSLRFVSRARSFSWWCCTMLYPWNRWFRSVLLSTSPWSTMVQSWEILPPGNRPEEVPVLSGLAQLETLNLSHNKIEELVPRNRDLGWLGWGFHRKARSDMKWSVVNLKMRFWRLQHVSTIISMGIQLIELIIDGWWLVLGLWNYLF